eukprot:g1135.t1
MRLIFHQAPQPWHPQSTMLHEAVIAAKAIGGDDFANHAQTKLFEKQSFTDKITWNMTRQQIYEKLAEIICANGNEGKQGAFMDYLKLDETDGKTNSGNAATRVLKFCVKHHRKRGIHVTPTCALNGLEIDTSSSWKLDEWSKLLDPCLLQPKI